MFRPEVHDQLGYYVYRLVDPRNGRTFYVGKGRGNRVFAHVAGGIAADETAQLSPKLDLIAAIRTSGREVEHHIHRHGLDETTAFHVEAALIDAYPQLTNAVRGHGADLLGSCRAQDLILRYQAEPAVWHHAMLLVGIRLTGDTRSTYDAARYAWPLSKRKLDSIDFVLAVREQRIVDAFSPTAWLPATRNHFPDADVPMPGRVGFIGEQAPAEVRALYLGKRLPDGLSLSQVGIRYVRPEG